MRYHWGFAAAIIAVVSMAAKDVTFHDVGGLGHGLLVAFLGGCKIMPVTISYRKK